MRRFRKVKCTSTIREVQILAWFMNRDHIGLADLAHRAGVSEPTLYRWFRMNGNPSWLSLKACFDVFGVDPFAQLGKLIKNDVAVQSSEGK